MSLSNRRSNTPLGGVNLAAWFWFAAAMLFAIAMAWQPTARMLAFDDDEANEVECRSQYQRDHAKLKAAAKRDPNQAEGKESANPDKDARQYCVERRSAFAAERQRDIARWAAGVSFLALLAAGAAAFAAFRTVRTMQESAEKQLRAYVTAKPGNMVFSGRIPMKLHMEARNTGQTPAYNVVMLSRFQFLPFPLPADFDFGPDPPITESTNVLAAGDSLPGDRPLGRPMGMAREAQLAAGTHRWYAIGIVKYRDAFGYHRTTRYCASAPGDQMLRGMGLADGDAGDIAWEYTAEHNDAD